MANALKLIACLALPLMVGAAAGLITAPSITTWYVLLNKPSFNPPNGLFGPVWTLLYLLMGVSFYLVIKQPNVPRRLIGIFVIQLVLNFLWSIIFFNFHQLGLAFIEMMLLWGSIVAMMVLFYKVNKLAALLNIPYLLWVSFAALLNYSIYNLNLV